MSAAGMIVPAWTTKGDAGLTKRSGLVVRRSIGALTKASFRSWPFWVNDSSEDIVPFEGVSLDADPAAGGRMAVLANTLLMRAASVS